VQVPASVAGINGHGIPPSFRRALDRPLNRARQADELRANPVSGRPEGRLSGCPDKGLSGRPEPF